MKLFIITVLIVALSIGLLIGQAYLEKWAWDDGQCLCGGHYELFDIESIRNGSSKYYYRCDECKDVMWSNFYHNDSKN